MKTMKTFSDNIQLDQVIKEERRVRAVGVEGKKSREEEREDWLLR